MKLFLGIFVICAIHAICYTELMAVVSDSIFGGEIRAIYPRRAVSVVNPPPPMRYVNPRLIYG